jgi:lipoprotein-anchoring transpeptidase ErfK/SrfK
MTASRRSWTVHCRAALVKAILAAANQFPEPGQDKLERVHDVRKTLKGAAGLARLFTPVVGAPAYQALSALKTARRSVGRARDLDVMPGVLARLSGPTATRDVLLSAIAEQREAEREAHQEIDAPALAAELRALGRSAGAWNVETAGVEPLLLALRRTYRAARRLGHRALASREAGDLHALRVRVVDLAHQLAALEPAWPAMMQAMGRELHRLRTALGDHNDLTVLAEFARGRSKLPVDQAEALIALIALRRRPLERRAGEQFARLFRERPGAFERRIAAYLERPQHKPGASARRSTSKPRFLHAARDGSPRPAPQAASAAPAPELLFVPGSQVVAALTSPAPNALEARPAELYQRHEVDYAGAERPGTIVIDTQNKLLYLVLPEGRALRYGVGVGRLGFDWAGVKTISRKAEWPGRTPPPQMMLRRPNLPSHMDGGPGDPLGARALDLGSAMCRIHGANGPSTIGQNVSSGCIRMLNEDVIDLYNRVHVGTRVIVV